MADLKKTKARLVEELNTLRGKVRRQDDLLQRSLIHSGNFASAMDAIIIIDEEQNIVEFNAAAEQIFGYALAAVRGKPIHMLLPEKYREAHKTHVRQYGETASTSRNMHSLGALIGLRADGSAFPHETSVSHFAAGGRKYFGVVVRDIGERVNLESLMMRQYDSLNTLHLITIDLLNQRDIRDLLQFIVDQAVTLLEVSYCEILLPEGEALIAKAFTRNKPFAGGNRFTREQAYLSWQVFDTGLPLVVDDYATWPQRQTIYESESFHAAAGLPLLVGGRAIGVLGMTRDKPGYKFTEEQILTASRLAAIAALAIENSRLLLEVQRLATTDELTGVHNRRSLMESGEREVQRAVRYGRDLAVIMLDVDHFKRVNDTWGHPAGDAVLREVAQESSNQIRRTDTIARYATPAEDMDGIIGRFGGEEFGILLPETSLEGAKVVAERIRASIAARVFRVPFQTDGSESAETTDIQITVSLGISSLLSKTDTFAELLARADNALYTAKQSGRNRVCTAIGTV